MIIAEDGRVGGSIDLAQLAGLYAQASDEDLKAHYRQVAAENGLDLDVSSEQPAEPEPEPEPEPAPAEDLSSLTKTELVDRANAAGIDTDGKTKADLLAELGG